LMISVGVFFDGIGRSETEARETRVSS
jgi:hypothetical protein